MSAMPRRTQGVVLVHSASKAMTLHVEWAIGSILGSQPTVDWTPQPALPGTLRCELSWTGEIGTGARIASALRGWAPAFEMFSITAVNWLRKSCAIPLAITSRFSKRAS